MDQRPPGYAHRAPRLPVPPTTTPGHPMTTPTAPALLYTGAWPHHPGGSYRPLMPGTVGATTSAHGQTSGDGYTPYSLPPTFSQMGITSPGHVDRWYVRDGHALTSHLYNVGYYQYPFTRPRLCGSDSETQDNRFPLPQSGEMQMPAAGMGPLLTPAVAERNGPGACGEPGAGFRAKPIAGLWGEPGAAL
jgi:hypothetical protein